MNVPLHRDVDTPNGVSVTGFKMFHLRGDNLLIHRETGAVSFAYADFAIIKFTRAGMISVSAAESNRYYY